MGDRAGSIPVIRTDKKARHRCVSFFYGADAALAPVGSRSPLRSGRCKANVRRTLCTLSSAENSSAFKNFKVFMIRKGFIMKNDDRSDLIFDDLYEPDITGMDLTDEEMEKIRKEHERLGIED